MSEPQLILYDDLLARSWFPFTLTRPAGELLFGALTLRERAERIFGARCHGHLTDVSLAGFDEPGGAPVLDGPPSDTSRLRLFLSSRAVPGWGSTLPASAARLRIGDEVLGHVCPPGTPSPPLDTLLQPTPGASVEVQGQALRHVWDLMTRNPEQLRTDLEHMLGSQWSAVPAGVFTLGEPRLALGSDVSIDPGVLLDFREGPIRLDDGAEVRAFTRLAGPAYVGKGTSLLGGRFTSVSIGPTCRVHGEVEATVMLGFTNKAHDGFLGHAYVGRWVNLGAMTTNSDLKNNYGPVRLWTPAGVVDTGEQKIGCFIGDHVKTAIGSLINTGTVVGPGSNLFSGMPAKYVPPFSWGDRLDVYEFDKFIATAEAVMARRAVQLTSAQREVLRRAWQRGRELSSRVEV